MALNDDHPAESPAEVPGTSSTSGLFSGFATAVSKDIAQWSVIVSLAVGFTFVVGAALLTARLFESYGVTPTAVLTSLPRGFILETGIEHVILPAGVLVLALRAIRRHSGRFLQRWRIPHLRPRFSWDDGPSHSRRYPSLPQAVLGWAVVAAIPSAIGLLMYPHRQHPIPAVERFLTGWLFLLAFLLIVAELFHQAERSLVSAHPRPPVNDTPSDATTVKRIQRSLAILAVGTQLIVVAGFVIAVWAYVPLPEGVACGTGNTFTYIYATTDTVYAAELARSSSTTVEPGSGFLAIIPSAQAKTTLVGHHVGLRNCRVAAALQVVVRPQAGRVGEAVWATPVASDPVDHLRGGTPVTLSCSDQAKGPGATPVLGTFAQISSAQDSGDWIGVSTVVLRDGTSPDKDLLTLPACT